MKLRAVLAAYGIVFSVIAAPQTASGQGFDVPDGFVVSDLSGERSEPDVQPILRIQPESGSFAALSTLSLAKVNEAVTDPNSWLESRVAVDAGSEKDFQSLLDSPDSPFGSSMFDPLRSVLPQLFDGLNSLGRTPLAFCDEPQIVEAASGQVHELSCSFEAGPFRRFLTYRLHEVDGQNYYVRIDSMNERRMRHLTAIANSFDIVR